MNVKGALAEQATRWTPFGRSWRVEWGSYLPKKHDAKTGGIYLDKIANDNDDDDNYHVNHEQ